LPVACLCVFFSLWLDKGLGLIVGGFVPSPLDTVTTYTPTLPEWSIVMGIWAIGALLITVFYKIALSVHEEVGEHAVEEESIVAGAVSH
jgi:[DsrC]-trisulfide reductase subunit P